MTSGFSQSVSVPRPGNTARSAVEALFRHRALFAATAGMVLFLTFLVTLATPPSYESEMHILVRDARPAYMISSERSPGQIMPQEVTETLVNSEIDVLRSKDVVDVVVDPDWTKTPLAQRPEADIRQHERSVVDFANHLTVEPLRKSDVIRVAYVTTSPREATEAVDRLLQAFLAKQHEIADAMNQQLVNVAVAERPTFSARPYRPQVLLNCTMGLVTAFLFAFTAVFLAELSRDTVATPGEFEAISGADVLATAPLIAEIEAGFAMGGRSPRAPSRRRSATDYEPAHETPAFTDILRPTRTYGALALSPSFADDAELPISRFHEPGGATAAAIQPEIPVPVMVETQSRSAAAGPAGDPCHRRLHRPLNDPLIPVRSNLSPSQRAQLRPPAASRESEDRAPYVTYTVDPRP